MNSLLSGEVTDINEDVLESSERFGREVSKVRRASECWAQQPRRKTCIHYSSRSHR